MNRIAKIIFALSFLAGSACGCCPLCKSSVSVVKGRWIEFDRQAVQYLPEQGGSTYHWAAGQVVAADLPDGQAVAGNQKAEGCLVVAMTRSGRQAFLIIEHPAGIDGQAGRSVFTVYHAPEVNGIPGDFTMISAGGPYLTARLGFAGNSDRPTRQPVGPASIPAGSQNDQPQLSFIVPRQPKDSGDRQRQTIADIQKRFGRVLKEFVSIETQE